MRADRCRNRQSHTYQVSRGTRPSHLSPTSPQLWIRHVNKRVDKPSMSVRFGKKVRLSPFVDYLWTKIDTQRLSLAHECVHPGSSCVRPHGQRPHSTTVHDRVGIPHTPSPQGENRELRGSRGVIHTFPSTYDDDYLDTSFNLHNDITRPVVDHSRNLSTPMAHTSRTTKTLEGGHE